MFIIGSLFKKTCLCTRFIRLFSMSIYWFWH